MHFEIILDFCLLDFEMTYDFNIFDSEPFLLKVMHYVRLCAILIIFFSFSSLYSQKGKDGAKIISANTVVNAFTALTANASAGNTILTVASSALGTNFTSTLTPGDVIMVIQMQGAP